MTKLKEENSVVTEEREEEEEELPENRKDKYSAITKKLLTGK